MLMIPPTVNRNAPRDLRSARWPREIGEAEFDVEIWSNFVHHRDRNEVSRSGRIDLQAAEPNLRKIDVMPTNLRLSPQSETVESVPTQRKGISRRRSMLIVDRTVWEIDCGLYGSAKNTTTKRCPILLNETE
jgi:hypothetical protein